METSVNLVGGPYDGMKCVVEHKQDINLQLFFAVDSVDFENDKPILKRLRFRYVQIQNDSKTYQFAGHINPKAGDIFVNSSATVVTDF
jgi:hypothetical protein